MYHLIYMIRWLSEQFVPLVEYRYNCLHKKKICFFRKIRNLSETCARLANRTEVNINDIYSHGPLSFLREKEELKELEKQAEIDIAVAREKVVSFLEYCRENGKIIIITTDMYLEQDTIEQILIYGVIRWITNNQSKYRPSGG